MSFRQSLRERAAKIRKRIVLCEGDDARVRAAAERIRAERIAEPIGRASCRERVLTDV